MVGVYVALTVAGVVGAMWLSVFVGLACRRWWKRLW